MRPRERYTALVSRPSTPSVVGALQSVRPLQREPIRGGSRHHRGGSDERERRDARLLAGTDETEVLGRQLSCGGFLKLLMRESELRLVLTLRDERTLALSLLL